MFTTHVIYALYYIRLDRFSERSICTQYGLDSILARPVCTHERNIATLIQSCVIVPDRFYRVAVRYICSCWRWRRCGPGAVQLARSGPRSPRSNTSGRALLLQPPPAAARRPGAGPPSLSPDSRSRRASAFAHTPPLLPARARLPSALTHCSITLGTRWWRGEVDRCLCAR